VPLLPPVVASLAIWCNGCCWRNPFSEGCAKGIVLQLHRMAWSSLTPFPSEAPESRGSEVESYTVVHAPGVWVRSYPDLDAEILGFKAAGDVLRGRRLEHDGIPWLQMPGPAYALIDASETKLGLGILLVKVEVSHNKLRQKRVSFVTTSAVEVCAEQESEGALDNTEAAPDATTDVGQESEVAEQRLIEVASAFLESAFPISFTQHEAEDIAEASEEITACSGGVQTEKPDGTHVQESAAEDADSEDPTNPKGALGSSLPCSALRPSGFAELQKLHRASEYPAAS